MSLFIVLSVSSTLCLAREDSWLVTLVDLAEFMLLNAQVEDGREANDKRSKAAIEHRGGVSV
jgi:hypothetical protein